MEDKPYISEHQDENEERPPVFKSWPQLYAFVLTELALLILSFYLFTQIYS